MTTQERKEEIHYRVEERLGLLCPEGKPTAQQTEQAWQEAVRDVNAIKELQ